MSIVELKTMRTLSMESPGWSLGQAWEDQPGKSFQPGRVWFGFDVKNLVIFTMLDDTDIFTRATRFDEELYRLGDTLEIFIEKEDRESYLELHVAPNGLRCPLEWPSGAIDRVRAGEGKVLDFLVADPDFFQAEVVLKENSWEILCHVPLCYLVNPAGEKWPALRVSISRYDHSSQGGDPVISSTSPHSVRDFHRRPEWRTLDLNALKSSTAS